MAGEWYNVGDDTDLELVYDLNDPASYTAVSGDVTALHNIGSAASVEDLLPTTGDAPLSSASGFQGMTFDGGAAIERYSGGDTYAAGFMNAEREVFALSIYYPSNASGGNQASFGIGATGQPDALHLMNPLSAVLHRWRYEPPGGSRIELVDVSLPDADDAVSVSCIYHNGVNEITCWHNGMMMEYKNAETAMPAANNLSASKVAVGDLPDINFPLIGDFIGLGVNNSGSLSWDDAYTKYAAAYNSYGSERTRNYLTLVSLGQSNSEGNFPGGSETFANDGYDFFQNSNTTGGTGLNNRNTWGHGLAGVGDSNPGIWFLKEWMDLNPDYNVFFQQQAEGSVPVIPGMSGDTAYWAPEHVDGLGQDARMTTLAPNFQNFWDLQRYSPGMNAMKVGFLICGEGEAASFTASDPLATQSNFEFHLNRWFNLLRDTYGFTHFAIVLTGRRGTNQATVDANAAGVSMARDALTAVINSRPDCYSVYEHLNNTNFVLDDLVVDGDGYWVSGQANNADGLHYTSAQYEAIGRTAARNFQEAINSQGARNYLAIGRRMLDGPPTKRVFPKPTRGLFR